MIILINNIQKTIIGGILMNEYIEWLREEYDKAEQKGRIGDMDLIAAYLEIEEIDKQLFS